MESDVEKKIFRLHRRIENLETKIENLGKNVDDINIRMHKLDTDLMFMKQSVQNLERNRIEILNTRVLNLETVVYG